MEVGLWLPGVVLGAVSLPADLKETLLPRALRLQDLLHLVHVLLLLLLALLLLALLLGSLLRRCGSASLGCGRLPCLAARLGARRLRRGAAYPGLLRLALGPHGYVPFGLARGGTRRSAILAPPAPARLLARGPRARLGLGGRSQVHLLGLEHARAGGARVGGRDVNDKGAPRVEVGVAGLVAKVARGREIALAEAFACFAPTLQPLDAKIVRRCVRIVEVLAIHAAAEVLLGEELRGHPLAAVRLAQEAEHGDAQPRRGRGHSEHSILILQGLERANTHR
mmetsp:Transcript_342/g.854  ORF Transcript_342/g.854 Transcript_342/m.854 type:complete len:281 (-) Transcript_342:976-1818(-)